MHCKERRVHVRANLGVLACLGQLQSCTPLGVLCVKNPVGGGIGFEQQANNLQSKLTVTQSSAPQPQCSTAPEASPGLQPPAAAWSGAERLQR